MKLSAKESRLVERLRKNDRQWRFTRWLLMIGGVALIIVWAWMLLYVSRSAGAMQDKKLEMLVQAMAYPKVLFGMIIGSLMIGFALRDWYGSPTRTLLLRLLDDHQAELGSAPNCGPTPSASSSEVTKGPQSVS